MKKIWFIDINLLNINHSMVQVHASNTCIFHAMPYHSMPCHSIPFQADVQRKRMNEHVQTLHKNERNRVLS